MSNYTVTTNFGAKDALVSGNPAKLILGAQLTTEYNNIATAVATKYDASTSAVLLGAGSAPAPSLAFGTSPTTGFYQSTTNVVGFSANGIASAFFGAGGFTVLSATAATTVQMSGTATGTSVVNTYNILNDASTLAGFGLTSSTFTGAVLTGGPTGQQAYVNVSAAVPLVLGTSNTARLVIDTSGNVNVTNGVSLSPIYSGVPQNIQVGSTYTAVLTDASKHIFGIFGGSKTYTIPANASVAYPVGTQLTFIAANGTMNIAITTDSMTLAGSASTGTRVLATNGIATAIKSNATSWIISGFGLT